MHTRTTEPETGESEETKLVDEVLARFHFPEPQYEELFKSHATQVVQTLSQLGRELTVENVIAHLAPDQLFDLSKGLPRERGESLMAYLADLPPWATRYLSDTREFSLEWLGERGFVPRSSR